jgi:hypothetical protein
MSYWRSVTANATYRMYDRRQLTHNTNKWVSTLPLDEPMSIGEVMLMMPTIRSGIMIGNHHTMIIAKPNRP